MIGSEAAGTQDYAAPEQLDPNRYREVGPRSDIFGFGRSCLFARFKTTQPRAKAVRALPEPWPDLLDECCDQEVEPRPKDFAEVLERLAGKPVLPPPPPPSHPDQFTNTLGMTMVRIKPGVFQMGSTKAQIDMLLKQFANLKREWYEDEQPQHSVKITKPFYLAEHQVTVGQFRRFIESSGYRTEAEMSGEGSYGWDGKEWKLDPKKNWRNPGFTQGDDHPVVCVSHNDARAFLGWLSDQEKEKKRGYCLPTEAQWEYACRARTGGLYGDSDDPESLVRFANVADASYKKAFPNSTCIRGDDGFVYTAPVGSFEPNAWHLYDMIGNVWEWCDDWFDGKFYQSSPEENPHNTAAASYRVIRGGGWHYHPADCRPAYRYGGPLTDRYYCLGFRVAEV
jgi:formylglycine-generating enzyme required for sulfatase activity